MEASLLAYTAQKSLFDRLDLLSNNVANVNTGGFKSDLAVYLKPTGTINGKPSPVAPLKSAINLSQGSLRTTNRDLDASIQGEGFFQVETPLGPRYTRSGSFAIDASGALVTKEGYAVVGDGGPISFTTEDSQVRIAEDGAITVTTPGGDVSRGKLAVFTFEDKSSLKKLGNTLFSSDSEGVNVDPADFKIMQGTVEDSNANQVEQMVELIDVTRSAQSLAKIIQDENQRVKSAVQRIAGK